MKTTNRCIWEQRVMDKKGLGINDGRAEIIAAIPIVLTIAMASMIGKMVQKEIRKAKL